MTNNLVAHLDGIADKGNEFNAKSVLNKTSIDVITNCAFGEKINSFEDPDNPFTTNVRLIKNYMGSD